MQTNAPPFVQTHTIQAIVYIRDFSIFISKCVHLIFVFHLFFITISFYTDQTNLIDLK